MTILEVLAFISLLITPIILALFSKIYNEKYNIAYIEIEDENISRFAKEITNYRINKKIDYDLILNYMKYVIIKKIIKKLNYNLNTKEISYNELKKIFDKKLVKKIKNFINDINNFKVSIGRTNLEERFIELLHEYREIIGEIDGRS